MLNAAHYAGRDQIERLAYLERQVAKCRKCPNLAATRQNTVFGEGNPESGGIVIVGEAPGADEDGSGRPFVGRAGQLLDRGLRQYGLLRQDVYICNCVKCRPDPPLGQSNRPPTRAELQDCLPYLLAQLQILEPSVIVALGNAALDGLGLDAKISDVRGKVIRTLSWPMVPTWHPACVLRNPTPDVYAQFYSDLGVAFQVITG
jgi:DNA polymerase